VSTTDVLLNVATGAQFFHGSDGQREAMARIMEERMRTSLGQIDRRKSGFPIPVFLELTCPT
jgi:hypothetical protein